MTKFKVFGKKASEKEVEKWLKEWKNGRFASIFERSDGQDMYGYREDQLRKYMKTEHLADALFNLMHPSQQGTTIFIFVHCFFLVD
jgi:hypothetical protein